MWEENNYVINGEVVGSIWFRECENFWKWGYTCIGRLGFLETDKESAKTMVEEMAKAPIITIGH